MNRYLASALALSMFMPVPAIACDLALALAVDVSGSVGPEEYRIQMDGLAAALSDSTVSEALVQADARVLVVQWSGLNRQQITIPWTTIDSFAAVEALAGRVAEDQRIWRDYSTAIGEVLMFTTQAFDQVPECERRVIDISGDGVSNEGIDPARLHASLRAALVTVNAVAIEQSDPDLTVYFYENVIFGEGAFVETASGFLDFPEAIRRKLRREVTRPIASSFGSHRSQLVSARHPFGPARVAPFLGQLP